MAKFRVPKPFNEPILSPEPSVLVHQLNPEDHFVIFASDGLWDHLSNEEAVDIVNSYPRHVSPHIQTNDFPSNFMLIVLRVSCAGHRPETREICSSRSSEEEGNAVH